MITELTSDAVFNEFLTVCMAQAKPAFVMVFMYNCPFCAESKPHFRRLAEIHGAAATFAGLDLDRCVESARALKIDGAPIFLGLWKGKPVVRLEGGRDYDELEVGLRRLVTKARGARGVGGTKRKKK